MTARFEDALKKLSPQQMETLLAQAETMASELRTPGRKLRVDWGGCIDDAEHPTGIEAQRAAMRQWTEALERSSGQ